MEVAENNQTEGEIREGSENAVPEPSQFSLSIAELIEIYVVSKAKDIAGRAIDERDAAIATLEQRLEAVKEQYPKKILEFADKLQKRNAVVKDDVLDKFVTHFGLIVKKEKETDPVV